MRVKAAITVRKPEDELRRRWDELKGDKEIMRHDWAGEEGDVTFVAAPGDRGTELHVDLDLSPTGGVVGARLAKVLGEDPEQKVKDDLRRFKQVVETGEVVRSDGSPAGHSAKQHLKQRPAQPLDEPVGSAS